MDQRKSNWDPGVRSSSAKGLTESRYLQMLQWAVSLTRGDESLAVEIVQDLCLQLTLSSPDFDQIANLDGYLYTCLRHLYVSRLTRASREAVRFVSIEDCDSIQFALDNGHLPDSVEIQNQLRRICSYSLWRREASKSFACFILHFFHGYFHREIADLACLPMAAIYNKLKAARAEIKSHLREPEKLQFLNRSVPPDPRLSWTTIPSAALFRELREMVLASRVGSCLPEPELLSWYRSPSRGPIPCVLLAHIVSCERCLDVVDRQFQRPGLQDRDALDGYDRALRAEVHKGASTVRAMPGSIERRRRRLYEHRPLTLSLAVNGRVVASHNVQGETSVLSARIERPERAQFVEVFSEQDVRLAMLPVHELPPQGSHMRVCHVTLSEERDLELRVAFDGLGLNSELVYRDPALAAQELEEEFEQPAVCDPAEEEPVADALSAPQQEPSRSPRWLNWLLPSSAPAWALAIFCLMITAGWIAWRIATRPLSPDAILQRSIESEAAALKGNAEHEEFLFEQLNDDGHVMARGTVDVWKDGSRGRMIRRLYDVEHHLVAATWRLRDGTEGSYMAKSGPGASRADRELAGNGVWSQDVSSEAFRSLAAKSVRGGATADGYELKATVHDARRPQVVAATLILDRRFRPIDATLRMRAGAECAEVRYRQIAFASQPASAVPDSVFDPGDLENGSFRGRSSLEPQRNPFAGTDAESAQLELAVLYQLFVLHADADEPIEIARTPGHRIRVDGSVADDATRRAIMNALSDVPGHEALDVHVLAPGQQYWAGHRTESTGEPITVYSAVQSGIPADAALRRYLAAKGKPAAQMDAAVAALEHNALDHAQHALQQAYALNRLGNAFNAEELRALPADARREWAAMVAGHAQSLQAELLALEQPLLGLAPHGGSTALAAPNVNVIGDPESFARATTRMLSQAQSMNRQFSDAFTSAVDGNGAQNPDAHNPDALLAAAVASIPLPQAQALSAFASRLNGDSKSIGHGTATTARRIP